MQSSFRNELVNTGLLARFAGNVRKRSGIITDLVEPWRVGTTSGATIVRDAPSHWQESVNSSTSADYVYYTLDAKLKITLPLTFTFWFKSLGTSATGGTVAGVVYDVGITNPYLCWAIGLENPNQRFRLMSNNGSFQTVTSSVNSSAFTTWTHVCATITSGKRIVWVNGKEVINTTGHGNPSYSSTSYLCLGEPGGNASNCRVADFKIFASEFNNGRACADMLAGRRQFPGEQGEFPYYLVGEVASGSTSYNGTAAVNVGSVTCYGSATHTAPSYTGNAAVTCGAGSCSGSATSADPIYSGNAAVTCGAATCSGAATSTDPIYSGNAAVTTGATTASGTAQFAGAIYSGNAAVTCGAATASGTATHTTPIYSGNATVTTGPTTASGTATSVAPAYDTGTGYVNFADQYFFGGIL